MSTILALGFGLFVAPLVLGFLVGLARNGHTLAPVLATGLVLLAYGALLAVEGIWAARCWSCSVYHDPILGPLGLYNEDERRIFFKFTAFIFAIPASLTFFGIWFGVLIAWRQKLAR